MKIYLDLLDGKKLSNFFFTLFEIFFNKNNFEPGYRQSIQVVLKEHFGHVTIGQSVPTKAISGNQNSANSQKNQATSQHSAQQHQQLIIQQQQQQQHINQVYIFSF